MVIPIGSDVLDTTPQGFVTQQVTFVLNMASVVTLAIMIWYGQSENIFRNHPSRHPDGRMYVCVLGVYTASLACLFFLHPQMGSLLNPDDLSVVDTDRFYRLHRVYLWISTVQWLSTIGFLLLICRQLSHERT